MATYNRNEWLNTLESDLDSEQGYDSEEGERRKGQSSTKRRKLSHATENKVSIATSPIPKSLSSKSDPKSVAQSPVVKESLHADRNATDGEQQKPKTLNLKRLAKVKDRLSKTGVIYISRIPPYMTPQRLRTLLLPHAPKGLNRIFLTPESPEKRKARKKSGGTGKKSFIDGWVEFVSKADAKTAAALLNTSVMGGKKSNVYHDDIWNIRYLRGYKWADLMEQVQNEEKEREHKLRIEIAKGRREEKAFVAQVEQAKILRTRQERLEKNNAKAGVDLAELEGVSKEGRARADKRLYTQTPVQQKDDKDASQQTPNVSKILSQIF